MRRLMYAALAWCAIAAMPAQAQTRTYTYVDLVKKLTDLQGLATLPQPGEKCQQASSYDRASKYDAATGKYIGWDANGDGGGIIRMEGDQQVLAEMEGPGVIWRTWSAAPRQGHVRIYIDGQEKPVVDLPFASFFDGKTAPFNYSALVHDASSGKNCYVPIPFQKSCKITADKDWGDYYHFTYTTYPKGTVLPTFSRYLSLDDRSALDEANDILTARLGTDPAGVREGEETISRDKFVLKPGKSIMLARLRGPRAITALRVKPVFSGREDEVKGLRELAIRVTYDNDKQPSVWAPLGDFFGSVPGLNKYKSLPLGVTDDGMYCFWYMPFGKEARVEIVNDGKVARQLSASVTHAPLAQPMEKQAWFHAKWHRDTFLPLEPGRDIEWTMLMTEGIGRFVGVNLHVWNPKGGWWGEGDEMFYVDGEKFPSTFGTGSEDYFGYAWCNPALFQNAYHNQPYNSGNNRGNVSVDRWHIPDNGPFQHSWFGTIEKYYKNDRPTLYAATAYWYLGPGGRDPYSPAPVDQRLGYFDTAAPVPFKVKGALEGEDAKVLEITGGKTEVQEMVGYDGKWSGEKHLWWTGGKPGDRLVVSLPVEKAGKYTISGQLTKAVDYGIIEITLDGAKVAGPIDLYNDGVVPTGEQVLGTFDLTAGEHKLGFTIVGANEKAVKAYMVGLDYAKLELQK